MKYKFGVTPEVVVVMRDDNSVIGVTSILNEDYIAWVQAGGQTQAADPLPLRYSEYESIAPVRLITTNNTPTELLRRTIPQRTLVIAHLELEFLDVTNPAAGVACRHVEATLSIRRINNGATQAPISVQVDQYIPAATEAPGPIGNFITAVTSGNDIVFRATGVNGRTIHWHLSGRYKIVTNDGK